MGDECLTDLVWRDAGVTADSHILLVSAVVGAPRQMVASVTDTTEAVSSAGGDTSVRGNILTDLADGHRNEATLQSGSHRHRIG